MPGSDDVSGDLHQQLAGIEKELMNLSVKPQRHSPRTANALGNRPRSVKPDVVTIVPCRGKLSKNAFINLQRQHSRPGKTGNALAELTNTCRNEPSVLVEPVVKKNGGGPKEEFLMDLITRPSRKSSCNGLTGNNHRLLNRQPQVQPSNLKHFRMMTDQPSFSNESLEIASECEVGYESDTGHKVKLSGDEMEAEKKHLHEVFECRLNLERQRLDSEFGNLGSKLRKELEDLRRKRTIEREAFRDRLSTSESDLRNARSELNGVADELRRSQQECQALRLQTEDSNEENERLMSDNHRLEQRCAKLSDLNNENLQKHKSEKVRLEGVVKRRDAEVGNLQKEIEKRRRREDEVLSKGMRLAERNQELVAEVTDLHEAVKDLTAKLEAESADHKRELSTLSDEIRHLETCLSDSKDAVMEETEKASTLSRKVKEASMESAELRKVLETKERECVRLNQIEDEYNELKRNHMEMLRRMRAVEQDAERLRTKLEESREIVLQRKKDEEKTQVEIARLQRALREHHRPASTVTIASALHKEVDLVDVEAVPLSRLRKRSAPHIGCTATADKGGAGEVVVRPGWWDETDKSQSAYGREGVWDRLVSRTAPPSSALKSRPPSFSPDSERSLQDSSRIRRDRDGLATKVVIPVATYAESPNGSLELLMAEKNQVISSMRELPRNSAFRTTDENERWESLRSRLMEIEHEMSDNR